ncbi:hypothetical protein SAMN05660420_00365 [Desulfuromusa kysingii]|uniref:Uncharacterized protein n=1 Tax=Desulfuromusa kysingii TaxID=37625 RepID=A0A1H3W0M6_9BACT|nr:hypothetical protein SAMN05660420_00365 [Desulfuromusa kysingii]
MILTFSGVRQIIHCDNLKKALAMFAGVLKLFNDSLFFRAFCLEAGELKGPAGLLAWVY